MKLHELFEGRAPDFLYDEDEYRQVRQDEIKEDFLQYYVPLDQVVFDLVPEDESDMWADAEDQLAQQLRDPNATSYEDVFISKKLLPQAQQVLPQGYRRAWPWLVQNVTTFDHWLDSEEGVNAVETMRKQELEDMASYGEENRYGRRY